MHCKHCGNQIENDSKFCSFCGGKVEPIGQTFQQPQQPLTQVQPEPILLPQSEKSIVEKITNAFLIIGLVDFGFSLFWIILNLIAFKGNGYEIYSQIEPIIKPLRIINSIVILFLCFLYTKKREHKTLLLIFAACLLALVIYDSYLS